MSFSLLILTSLFVDVKIKTKIVHRIIVMNKAELNIAIFEKSAKKKYCFSRESIAGMTIKYF